MTLIAGMTLIDFFEKFHYDDYFKYDANYFLWKYPHMTLIMCMTFIRQSRVCGHSQEITSHPAGPKDKTQVILSQIIFKASRLC